METNGHMTAAVLYGREDLKIETVDIPRLADDDVLVRVEVALTCGTDLKVWKQGFHARMIQPPALFGHELAGVVETKGSAVNGRVHKGMRVVPSNSAPCNVCLYCRKGQPNLCEDLLFNNGAYAEFIRIPGRIVRQNMLEIPDKVSFVDAAMAEPLACVLRGVRADWAEVHQSFVESAGARDRAGQAQEPDSGGRTAGRDCCVRRLNHREPGEPGAPVERRRARDRRGD
jgi:L-iditol 2-dehydrogenase